MTYTPPPDGVSTAARVLHALEHHVVDGVVQLSYGQIAGMTGVSERIIESHLIRMKAEGVLVQLSRSPVAACRYQIARPELISRDIVKSWTKARVALIREIYSDLWNVDVAARLNELPGRRLSAMNVKDYAGEHDLRKSPPFVKNRKQPVRKIAAPKPAPVRVVKVKPAPAPVRRGARVIWRTADGVELFRQMWTSSEYTLADIKSALGMSEDTARRYREELGLAPRSGGQKPRPAEPPPVSTGPRADPGGRVYRMPFAPVRWNPHKLPAIEARPGLCGWPLRCDAAAVRKGLCADHGRAIYGARAA